MYRLVCEDGSGVTTTTSGAWARVLNVDSAANGAANGTSWADAFVHPQDAVDAAEAGDVVWVAVGRYPAQNSDYVLTVDEDVSVYGGFLGDETRWTERAGLFASTVLDGDTNGDDNSGAFTDNANHIVNLDTDSTLGGFVLRSAYRDGGINAGSAVFTNRSGVTIEDLHVLNIMEPADTQGVIFNDGDDLWVERVRIESDLRPMITHTGHTATVVNSTFICGDDRCINGRSGSDVEVRHTSFYQESGSEVVNFSGTSDLSHNVVYTPSGNALGIVDSVTYTAAAESQTGTGNIHLDDSTTALSNPFVVLPSGELLLSTDSAAVDAGLDTEADVWLPDWMLQTTFLDGTLDTTPVDLGAHYPAGRVVITALSDAAGSVTWTSTGTSCSLSDGGTTYDALPGTGSQTAAAGVWFLTCTDGVTDAIAMATL